MARTGMVTAKLLMTGSRRRTAPPKEATARSGPTPAPSNSCKMTWAVPVAGPPDLASGAVSTGCRADATRFTAGATDNTVASTTAPAAKRQRELGRVATTVDAGFICSPLPSATW